jgi:hypothetical protein
MAITAKYTAQINTGIKQIVIFNQSTHLPMTNHFIFPFCLPKDRRTRLDLLFYRLRPMSRFSNVKMTIMEATFLMLSGERVSCAGKAEQAQAFLELGGPFLAQVGTAQFFNSH